MTMRYTSNQGAPYPDVDEPLNNVNDWIFAIAQFFEKRAGARYSTFTELSNKHGSPSAGDSAFITSTKQLWVFDGSAWQRVYPPRPTIHSGTANPSSSLGDVGDIYLKVT